MSKATNIIAFAVGTAMGAVGAWYFSKKKYEKKLQDDIDSVKATFTYQKPEPETETAPVANDISTEQVPLTSVTEELGARIDSLESKVPDILEHDDVGYEQRVEDLGYMQPGQFGDRPRVISPEEFGEYEDYDLITLVYFLDGVLADTDNSPVEDIDKVIGKDSLNHFGEYEDDCVYVRNDRLKCDYEVLLDQREFLKAVRKRLN